MKRILSLILSVVMLLSIIPISAFATEGIIKFSSTEFDYASQADFDAVWETVAGNYRTNTNPVASTPASVTTTDDGKTAISAAISTTRASTITTLKQEYFTTDKRISSITAKMKTDTASTGALTNGDGAPGVYAMHINAYKSAVLQLGKYYNNKDAEDVNNGHITLQWSLFYDDNGTTTNGCSNSILDADNKNTRKNTSLNANDWITIKISYDYSDIANNSLKLSALVSDESGNSYTANCRVAFDESGNNAYSEGFKVGLSSTSSAKLPTYYDYFAIEFEKSTDDYVKEFKANHKEALLLTEETLKLTDEDIVKAALGAYNELSQDAKEALSEEYTLLTTLNSEFVNLEVGNGILFEDFEGGFDNWEVLNVEGGETGGSTFTDAEGGIAVNPKLSDINISANVLNADGVSGGTSTTAFQRNITVYKLKDSIFEAADDLSTVRGKVYQKSGNYNQAIILEYTDSNNYAGILFSSISDSGYGSYTRGVRAFKYVDGIGTQYASASYAKYMLVKQDCLADWQYFTVEYLNDRVRFAFTDENGIYEECSSFEILYGDTFGTETAVFTGENPYFAVSGWNSNGSSIPYYDDLEFVFANSDYADATAFVSENAKLLSKNIKTLTNEDTVDIEALIRKYNALSETAKAYLGLESKVSALSAAAWGDDAVSEFIEKYDELINSEINADNAAEFEAAWSVINCLSADEQKELSELREALVAKLTTYSGELDLTDKINVNVIGDSITYGYGLTGTSTVAWPARLQNALGENYSINNFAISGFRVVGDYETGAVQFLTDRYGNARKLAFDKDADIAIIALGINDSVHIGADPENRYPMLVEGYKTLIKTFLTTESCSTVIVSGSLWDCDEKGDKYNSVVCEAAKEACEATGAIYFDLYSKLEKAILGNEALYLQSDKLHYTEEGEQLIADFYIEFFNNIETVFRTESVSYFDVAAKSNQPKAQMPVIETLKDKTVTLAAVPGCEYSIDGVNWQTSNEFTGLTINTEYNFYQRFAETDTHFAGEASDALVVTTLGHQYDDACDTDCNLCGDIREITHDYDWVIDEPGNCGVAGKKHEECSVCHVKRSENTPIDATGNHTYNAGVVTKKATCTATGVKTYTCTTCRATKTQAIAKVAHKYTSVITKATTSKNGKIVKKCSSCGTVASTTTIYAAKTVKLKATSYTYNGKAKKPGVTIKDSKGKTISSKYYKVTYASGRKNVGKYKVTIKFTGNYSGTKTLYFTINPVKTSVSKLTAAKKALTVSISKKTKQVTGYEIQYATNKKFSKAKTTTVKSYKTTKVTLKKLSAKKTYYVRVRTYKTVNGKKYYSGWSTVKYKKTK